MGFWVDWELWEKMCSVLGCLIAIVLIYAFGILLYNRWRLKKYAVVEARERAEVERALDTVDEEKDNIPFGARAIESGIQIDGIWISSQNTPAPSPPQPATPVGSGRASSTTRKSSQGTLNPPPIMVTAYDENSSTETLHSQDETQALHPYAIAYRIASRGSEVHSLAADEEHLKRNETLELERSSHEYAAYRSYLQPKRCNTPVDRPTGTSTAQKENRRGSGVSVDSLTVSEGDFPPQRNSSAPERVEQSLSGSTNTRYLTLSSSYEQIKLNPVEDDPFHETTNGDLNCLHSHRLSHVAETGQLGSTKNSQVGFEIYDESIHPQELAEKLADVVAKGEV